MATTPETEPTKATGDITEKKLGTAKEDVMSGTVANDTIDGMTGNDIVSGSDGHDRVEGNQDNDTIYGGSNNDLAVGDKVGAEWSLVGDKWVYDASKLTGFGDGNNFDDLIYGGDGDDVVIGNGGADELYGGSGDDLLNAGSGDDAAFGGDGQDILNLDGGDDKGYGGSGADILNGGDGNDNLYGDVVGSVLAAGSDSAASCETHAKNGGWEAESGVNGTQTMSQTLVTSVGETYELSFDVGANVAGGFTSGTMEITWGGEVIATIDATAGLETYTFSVDGTGTPTELSFITTPSDVDTGLEIIEGPIDYYEKDMPIGGEDVSVAAFAPGQASLYQVINGQLKVFDTESSSYEDVGNPTGIKLNAIGFNVEDDMIYGLAKSDGVDALGNVVSSPDIVMIDAKGSVYKIGTADHGDYVGDFDDSGNLWTFNSSLDCLTKIDIDKLDAEGNPEITNIDLPNAMFTGRIYDIAYNAKEDAFYAIEAPKTNGGEGKIHRIDMETLDATGMPTITSVPIEATYFDGVTQEGMVKGAFGAVFLDGEGNLYGGLNRGDHDLDGSTGASGAIYKFNVDFENGTATAEFMSESQTTGVNDGAADPRSTDPFAELDVESPVLITSPTLTQVSGGDDKLRGGEGEDNLYGGGGDDILHGGTGDDIEYGGTGNDKIFGGDGSDTVSGDAGDDRIVGGAGNDTMFGGTGSDYLNGGTGDDQIFGGDGADKIVGGSGSDIIAGGAGNDHMWGGNWWRDGASDTFVVSQGGGKDMIHDFEVKQDQIDLSSYGLEFSDLKGLMSDKGWATEIDLSGLEGGSVGDKLIIKSIDPDELEESNFIL
jgi:Ca2+-binding RTX toxin-like protein